jgi:hypothetical protein
MLQPASPLSWILTASATVLISLGVLFLILIIRKRRNAPTHPRCPHCHYNLTSAPTNLPCPECGNPSTLHQRTNPQHSRIPIFLSLLPIVLGAAYLTRLQLRKLYYALPPQYTVDQRWQNQPGDPSWTITLLKPRDPDLSFDAKVQVHAGKTLLLDEPTADAFPGFITRPTLPIHPPYLALDPNTKPLLWLTTYSGGAHCCYEHFAFDLSSSPPRQVIRLQTNNASLFPQTIAPNTHRLHLIDDTWAYWNAPYSSSVRPLVILKLQNDQLVFDQELMRKYLGELRFTISPPTSPDQPISSDYELTLSEIMLQHAQLAFNRPDYFLTPATSNHPWAPMIHLPYVGHISQVLPYFNQLCPITDDPAHNAARNKFLTDFRESLKESPWATELKALNGQAWDDFFAATQPAPTPTP